MFLGNLAPLYATEESSHRVNSSDGESVKNKSTTSTSLKMWRSRRVCKRLGYTDSKKSWEGRISQRRHPGHVNNYRVRSDFGGYPLDEEEPNIISVVLKRILLTFLHPVKNEVAPDEYARDSGRTRTRMKGKTRSRRGLGKLLAFRLQGRGNVGVNWVFFPELCLRLLHHEFHITVPENQEDDNCLWPAAHREGNNGMGDGHELCTAAFGLSAGTNALGSPAKLDSESMDETKIPLR
ncbi:hypothetical protein EV421DRAFT_1738131 [Armillaria borealis]|uniref:Uncharacterized protein n=1 Tax=Armillaria borealis TaxID=47425 RepID=A0AA39JCR3_9AGAR|nr:hypothetical protein EV421DRAFT_1738131 [Armillaria borealis]